MAQLRSKRKAPGATMPGVTRIPHTKSIDRLTRGAIRREPQSDFLSIAGLISNHLAKSVLFAMRRGSIEMHLPREGLPLGYLNQLEQRLAETESALYGALMTIRSMGQATAAQATAKTETSLKHKAARMEEWSQLPLREWPDMERWLTAMSDRFTIEQPSDIHRDVATRFRGLLPMIDCRFWEILILDNSHMHGNLRDNTVSSGRSYDAHQSHPGVIASSVYLGHQVAVEPESGPSPCSTRDGITNVEDAVGVSVDADADADARAGVETGLSKAEELSHNNPSLYF
ncbi:hypothetical protein N7519_010114 [Penicillium mononematosum]|uniref:uncharacterized protein n=1 Tax=Penicillium mononematosum TaxID=268346 RepID=UPI00254659FC|nr:uncharacterized protein N7519_010114 [Penicillium mononematosum]KAJ6179653.1 hypothetical protein N7519_010114 [Penicillium mononematosum]